MEVVAAAPYLGSITYACKRASVVSDSCNRSLRWAEQRLAARCRGISLRQKTFCFAQHSRSSRNSHRLLEFVGTISACFGSGPTHARASLRLHIGWRDRPQRVRVLQDVRGISKTGFNLARPSPFPTCTRRFFATSSRQTWGPI